MANLKTPIEIKIAMAKEMNIEFKLIGKAIKASVEEVKQNPRSRSAILRIAEYVVDNTSK